MGENEYLETRSLVSAKRKKAHKVTALIGVSTINLSKLGIEPEESDHKWHADIIDWPAEKEEQKLAAIILSQHASRE